MVEKKLLLKVENAVKDTQGKRTSMAVQQVFSRDRHRKSNKKLSFTMYKCRYLVHTTNFWINLYRVSMLIGKPIWIVILYLYLPGKGLWRRYLLTVIKICTTVTNTTHIHNVAKLYKCDFYDLFKVIYILTLMLTRYVSHTLIMNNTSYRWLSHI